MISRNDRIKKYRGRKSPDWSIYVEGLYFCITDGERRKNGRDLSHGACCSGSALRLVLNHRMRPQLQLEHILEYEVSDLFPFGNRTTVTDVCKMEVRSDWLTSKELQSQHIDMLLHVVTSINQDVTYCNECFDMCHRQKASCQTINSRS